MGRRRLRETTKKGTRKHYYQRIFSASTCSIGIREINSPCSCRKNDGALQIPLNDQEFFQRLYESFRQEFMSIKTLTCGGLESLKMEIA